MKILLAVDGSPHSEAAIVDVARGSWPDGTAIEILSVIPARARLAVGPAFVMAAVCVDPIDERRRRPTMLVNAARDRIEGEAWGVQVTTKILEGNPRGVILDEAREWGADLIIVGAGGYGIARHMILGSVAGAVVANAPCSVQVVRDKQGSERPDAVCADRVNSTRDGRASGARADRRIASSLMCSIRESSVQTTNHG